MRTLMSNFRNYPSTIGDHMSGMNGWFVRDNGSWVNWNGSEIVWDQFGIESEVFPNQTLSPQGPKTDINVQILGVISFSVAAFSLLLNSCLLWSLSRVSISILRAKHLVQICTFVNLIVPLVTTIDLVFLVALFRVNEEISLKDCFNGTYFMILILASLIHTMSAVGLTLDRVYAVVEPLQYHTVGHNKLMKIGMPVVSIAVPVCICLGFVLSGISSFPRPFEESYTFCLFLYHTAFLIQPTKLPHIFNVAVHLLVFFIYIGIFVVIKYQSMKIKNVSESATRRNNFSLAITYFLVSTTAICFYLPWPLFSIYNKTYGPYVMYTRKALRITYFLNSILDPILFMVRIRSIRENLPFCKKRAQKAVSRITKSTETPNQRDPRDIPIGK